MLTRLAAVAGFDDDRGRLPGDIHMWVFVIGDLFIFGFYFLVFMIYRFHNTELFRESQEHLNLGIATANTVVLLTSSWLVAQSVLSIRASDHDRARRQVIGAIGLAGVFTALKVVEWVIEITNGHTLVTNDFFMFYFTFTGVHVFHVLLGVLVLGVVLHDLQKPTLRRVHIVEAGATYWHMVDVIWIVIFAIVYLLR